ncbi:hypothetical protein BJ742DRAFT_748776 [Cladochytrium replicatum]|nr:hypothetical protein BJ742DRAFT_748776 [Cladochytrium replicatum]
MEMEMETEMEMDPMDDSSPSPTSHRHKRLKTLPPSLFADSSSLAPPATRIPSAPPSPTGSTSDDQNTSANPGDHHRKRRRPKVVNSEDSDQDDDTTAAAPLSETGRKGAADGVEDDPNAPNASQNGDGSWTGLPNKRNTLAIQEEREGSIVFEVVRNDGTHRSMELLTGLKNIFQRQLPKMPREYIARLVYDRNHESMAVVREGLKVVGGIAYRPFIPRKFAEIVFCAIAANEQVKGYGSRLMSRVKDYVRNTHDIQYFLTYADNYAIGYFKKQGFTTDITLDKSIWVGYIKDYEGGTIMQCTMIPKVNYLDTFSIITQQRKVIFQKIRELAQSHIVYPGLTCFKEAEAAQAKKQLDGGLEAQEKTTDMAIDPASIPGIVEAGWTPEISQAVGGSPKKRSPLYTYMKKMIAELTSHEASWPFQSPVSGVADYYDIITEPMDLKTLDENVEEDVYATIADFNKDATKIFNNCRTYNEEGSVYVKCANRLERFFVSRTKSLTAEMHLG